MCTCGQQVDAAHTSVVPHRLVQMCLALKTHVIKTMSVNAVCIFWNHTLHKAVYPHLALRVCSRYSRAAAAAGIAAYCKRWASCLVLFFRRKNKPHFQRFILADFFLTSHHHSYFAIGMLSDIQGEWYEGQIHLKDEWGPDNIVQPKE